MVIRPVADLSSLNMYGNCKRMLSLTMSTIEEVTDRFHLERWNDTREKRAVRRVLSVPGRPSDPQAINAAIGFDRKPTAQQSYQMNWFR
ncbi:hypothetical protein TNCV_3650171 [Trichonephila clavipes]|nr:hypothetical protein TNCV_3650171 [Trichonephila clavipes]